MRNEKPNFRVKHPYAHLIQCLLLGIVLMLSSVLVSGTSLFGFNKVGNDSPLVEQETEVAAASGVWNDNISSPVNQRDTGDYYLSGSTCYIYTAKGLAYAAYNDAWNNYTFYIENDIDMSAHYFNDPFGQNRSYPFKGTFYGQGHKITLTLDSRYSLATADSSDGNSLNYGFVQYNNGGDFYDLTIEYTTYSYVAYSDGWFHFGGFVGLNYDSMAWFVDCAVTGNVFFDSGSPNVGGFVGASNYNMKFYRCVSNIEIDNEAAGAEGYLGGFVGYQGDYYSDFYNCVFMGAVIDDWYGKYTYVGGFIGRANGSTVCDFYSCVSAGLLISDNNNTSGYVGYVNSAAAPRLGHCFFMSYLRKYRCCSRYFLRLSHRSWTQRSLLW